MAENTFPVYKTDALINFFRINVLIGQDAKHFTKTDLTPNPKPEVIRLLYTSSLQQVYGVRPDCHSMGPLSENTQYTEYHEWTTHILRIYQLMCKFLPLCFVYDFSLNDLLAPKAKRTLHILSGIMNFLQFQKQMREVMLEHQARFREDTDKLQSYRRGIKEAENKIKELTTIPPEQQAEAKELATAIADLQNASIQEYQKVNGLKETIAERKTEIANISQKLSQMKVAVGTLKEENAKLKSQIVESPEELKRQMETMKETVKQIKESIERAGERLVEVQNAVQWVTQNEAEVQQLYKLLQDLHNSMSNCKQRQEEFQELEALYEKQQKELKNMVLEEGQLKKSLGLKLDKRSKQNIRIQKTKEMKDQHIQSVLGQCDQVQQKREEMADQIQDISRETQQLKAKMQNLRDVCSKETEKAQALYDHLSSSLDQFHKRIEKHLSEVNSDMSKMLLNF